MALFATLGTLPACSDVPEPLTDAPAELAGDPTGGEADEAALTDEQREEIGQLGLALNSDAKCGTADADHAFTSIISPATTSNNTYANGRNGCEKANFTRVSDYRTGNSGKFNRFQFAGPVPANEAACRDTKLMVYAFERKNGSASFVFNRAANGTPVFSTDTGTYLECQVATVELESSCFGSVPVLTTGSNYQFAVSARTNNSGNPVMQKIRMSSANRRDCP
jgi:hypothetical protein